MTEIRAEKWADFTKAVAEARSSGHDVSIVTGPEANGAFVAIIADGHDDVEAPEPAPEAKPKKAKAEAAPEPKAEEAPATAAASEPTPESQA